jgi:hypothetical protein
MFETHDAVGGYWHEQAYAAAIAFRPDGSVEGHYYQHPIVGSWTPRLKNTLVFTARLAEPAPHLRFQWEPGMLAIVTDDSLKLEWGLRKDRYDYLVRKATP